MPNRYPAFLAEGTEKGCKLWHNGCANKRFYETNHAALCEQSVAERSWSLGGFGRRTVVGRFDGGKLTSDGNGLLLREVEQRTHMLKRLAACFTDHRDPALLERSPVAAGRDRPLSGWPVRRGMWRQVLLRMGV